ncbi:MAG: nucleoside-triphosphatase [Bacillota bacterium]|jgi:nucleoside-triphosphatase
MKKLLLTGRPRCGKSSLIQKYILGLPVQGFTMQRLTRKGETWAFRLLDLAEEAYTTHLETEKPWDDIAISLIAPGKWQGNTAVFEGKGCRAIERALNFPGLAILDELGIFEAKALNFQQAVLGLLDSEVPVLGVLKDKHTPFLDKVRAHPRVTIVEYPSQEAVDLVAAFTDDLRRQKS